MSEKMSVVKFAKGELDLLGIEGEMRKYILQLIKVFSKQEHSDDFTAAYCADVFARLAMFKPLKPLTGEDDEWTKVAEGHYQNKRCPTVFKKNGFTYDTNGIVFRNKEGICYTNANSVVEIDFPYTPEPDCVDVEDDTAQCLDKCIMLTIEKA